MNISKKIKQWTQKPVSKSNREAREIYVFVMGFASLITSTSVLGALFGVGVGLGVFALSLVLIFTAIVFSFEER